MTLTYTPKRTELDLAYCKIVGAIQTAGNVQFLNSGAFARKLRINQRVVVRIPSFGRITLGEGNTVERAGFFE